VRLIHNNATVSTPLPNSLCIALPGASKIIILHTAVLFSPPLLKAGRHLRGSLRRDFPRARPIVPHLSLLQLFLLPALSGKFSPKAALSIRGASASNCALAALLQSPSRRNACSYLMLPARAHSVVKNGGRYNQVRPSLFHLAVSVGLLLSSRALPLPLEVQLHPARHTPRFARGRTAEDGRVSPGEFHAVAQSLREPESAPVLSVTLTLMSLCSDAWSLVTVPWARPAFLSATQQISFRQNMSLQSSTTMPLRSCEYHPRLDICTEFVRFDRLYEVFANRPALERYKLAGGIRLT
jgi:hypothetical protein